ncbi:OsmC family peroxiredoxin [Ornithinimicrobium humiphilum]|uniref:Osmotically inducible protein OsmC n=1 Tax=Ornithinimicrobium humiphilum TaxID=125288 RepID=A0A543KNF0_9MICO|nr:OsmC family protein [Ornithinimicrobium humiphilum]TQM96593.1 osmotically inducible protein OsmC [Ornithinimicrobium humiphilum]
MAPKVSTGSTTWQGSLFEGFGTTRMETSGLGSFEMTWKGRTEDGERTTNPEELIGAAHSACFSMAFSNMLDKFGTPPTQLDTRADVSFVGGEGITGIHITVRGQVDGISAEDFQRIAEEAKAGCPVSQALAGTEITLTAELA